MFDNSFCFLFSKTCFWEYKEKTIFLYFWNQKHVWLRLCLVAVKRFLEKFSEKENVFMCLVAFQKNFRKIFSGVWKRRRKRQSQQNTDKTQKKPRQKIINDWRSTRFDGAVLRELQSDDRAVDRAVIGLDGAISRRRDRDRRREIAIDGAISRRREDRDWRHEIAIDGMILWSINHDLAKHRADRDRRNASRDRDLGSRSSNWSSQDRRGLELGVRQRSSDWTGARSSTITRSLSLSLFFRKYFEVKMKV